MQAASDAWSYASPEFAALSFAFAVGAKLLYSYYNGPANEQATFIEYAKDFESPDDVVAVDCTHPVVATISHHRGNHNPAGLRPADTSAALVLNALQRGSQWKRELAAVLAKKYVTTNHFDIDSFLSTWCFLNRAKALEQDGVLRHMSRIGDFREAFLCPDLITAHGQEDNISFIREAYTALKLCCWINTLERRLFSAPYENKDCVAKMNWFLERFGRVLDDPESFWGDWQQEYTKVVSGFDLLSGGDCLVELFPEVGLAAISAPEPLHYYSLFSHSIGCDVVLTMYDGQRYEVECKYTQFVICSSRPVWPRLDMAPLAALLNQMESQQEQAPGKGEEQQQLCWSANRFTDSGPLLRLERVGERLTKAQRYGHPFDRPIYPSSIPPSKLQAIVQSFLEFGYHGLQPRAGGFTWQELHSLNDSIAWPDWASCVLEQHQRGDLDLDRFLTERAMRRRVSSNPAALGGAAAAAGPTGGAGSSSSNNSRGWTPSVGSLAEGFTPPGTPHAVPPTSAAAAAAAAEAAQGAGGPPGEIGGGVAAQGAVPQAPGTVMPAVGFVPPLQEPSTILTDEHTQALAGVLPPLYRRSRWSCLYSTGRDGISLHTLLRKAERAAPTVLVVRDGHGHVFGAFATEPWRQSTRFYGTGETFVFQLEPRRLMWPWLVLPTLRNDFFQYACPDKIGVGGVGHWGVCLDEELLEGTSGMCATFGSPCLAGQEDFQVLAVELWHVH